MVWVGVWRVLVGANSGFGKGAIIYRRRVGEPLLKCVCRLTDLQGLWQICGASVVSLAFNYSVLMKAVFAM
jgi:hypothetical protein